ncbi:MAG: ADP-ribosylglycohydrolase family protein [Akkermansiaceae bacterium]|nr:ADP-ribosylglycohydrolase family protein [Armatimonadota bacterium]
MDTNRDRIDRANLALEGLSVGDAFGETFFVNPAVVEGLILQRALAPPPWKWTDDTLMAFSVVENLREYGAIESDALVADFVARYHPGRGYGPTIGMAFRDIRDNGSDRHDVFPALFEGQGSYGNGAAMRVAPLGGYFADDGFETIVREARRSAETTHVHREGVAGSVAVAVAAAIAYQTRDAAPSRRAFLDGVLPHVPPSETREKIRHARDFDAGVSTRFAAEVLGTGHQVSAQDTVPFALFCAAEFLGNYEESLWQTVSGLGDRDTTCAIVGGIVALHTGAQGIPADWVHSREPLPRPVV